LTYEVRWRRGGGGDGQAVVVDRGYNTASISRASMGSKAVQDVQENGPNKLKLVLQPAGAPKTSVFVADLLVTARRVDPYPVRPDRPQWFACAETTRQTITTVNGERAQTSTSTTRAKPLIKEIETIVTYGA